MSAPTSIMPRLGYGHCGAIICRYGSTSPPPLALFGHEPRRLPPSGETSEWPSRKCDQERKCQNKRKRDRPFDKDAAYIRALRSRSIRLEIDGFDHAPPFDDVGSKHRVGSFLIKVEGFKAELLETRGHFWIF
jgi:hypothetical protein